MNASANNSRKAMNELALFAGAGGGSLWHLNSGWRTVCAVGRELYAAGVLIANRMMALAPFPGLG